MKLQSTFELEPMDRDRALSIADKTLEVVPAQFDFDGKPLHGFTIRMRGPGHGGMVYSFDESKVRTDLTRDALVGQLALRIQQMEVILGGNNDCVG